MATAANQRGKPLKTTKQRYRYQPATLELDFVCTVDHSERPTLRQVRRWIKAALDHRVRHVQVGIRVVDTEEGRLLNRDYRGKDYATNVLTFALHEGGDDMFAFVGLPLLGDIVLCHEVIVREAAEQNKPLLAHYAHMTIHSVLHLQGMDHQDDATAEAMEALETAILARLGYADPYASERN